MSDTGEIIIALLKILMFIGGVISLAICIYYLMDVANAFKEGRDELVRLNNNIERLMKHMGVPEEENLEKEASTT